MNEQAKKVLVALSGGVDSSVATALLIEQGYDVMTVTLKTFCYQNEAGPKACCGLDGIAAAKAVSAKLNVPHIVLDVSESFQKEVIEDFVSEYACGRTPNPCVRCNATVKIPYLLEKARSYGCSYLATGHYANIEEFEPGQFAIRRGKDKKKDQSYFLWEIPSEVLPHLLLPLGDFEKSEIRDMAKQREFANAQRPESQEICFVPDGDYVEFLKKHLPSDHKGLRPGNIIGPEQKIFGRHNGYINYTVGQRKGIGGGHDTRLYVTKIDPVRCEVYIGDRDSIMGSEFQVEKINSIIGIPKEHGEFMVQIRYKTAPVECEIVGADKNCWKVRLKKPISAISPGQSAVFYSNNNLVAGGKIVIAEKI